jgi:hypothetical protein
MVGDSNSVTVSLTEPITTQFNSTTHQNEWWSYQYNLFWSNSSSSGKYPFMSQTTFDDNSGMCKIGTGYGTHTEQIQQLIDCSELTQADDSGNYDHLEFAELAFGAFRLREWNSTVFHHYGDDL